ncbi:hypothetical protein, variant [Thecamonas trahens ATCC 50062]|uniref:Uncharacterized protein n=1 Tax=Thecamonas trahens ATCC 50062 TaxID=461836 RepID=A0A0L0DHE1_THETB|nr:hypothetical protein, variant [Thecamonas trahens ATCC 50062]KNC50728.1 hypothetical protein, variant [Thecamonas trahens ATCC 50062]|eukprot:XP_013756696.1 hypothetical protein, variant [Thecamonas trahens ATCC 50062]
MSRNRRRRCVACSRAVAPEGFAKDMLLAEADVRMGAGMGQMATRGSVEEHEAATMRAQQEADYQAAARAQQQADYEAAEAAAMAEAEVAGRAAAMARAQAEAEAEAQAQAQAQAQAGAGAGAGPGAGAGGSLVEAQEETTMMRFPGMQTAFAARAEADPQLSEASKTIAANTFVTGYEQSADGRFRIEFTTFGRGDKAVQFDAGWVPMPWEEASEVLPDPSALQGRVVRVRPNPAIPFRPVFGTLMDSKDAWAVPAPEGAWGLILATLDLEGLVAPEDLVQFVAFLNDFPVRGFVSLDDIAPFLSEHEHMAVVQQLQGPQ